MLYLMREPENYRVKIGSKQLDPLIGWAQRYALTKAQIHHSLGMRCRYGCPSTEEDA